MHRGKLGGGKKNEMGRKERLMLREKIAEENEGWETYRQKNNLRRGNEKVRRKIKTEEV